MFATRKPATPVIGERTRVYPRLSFALVDAARAGGMLASCVFTSACAFWREARAFVTLACEFCTEARAAATDAMFARLFWTALSSSCWLTDPRWASGV